MRVAALAADAGVDRFWLGDGLLVVPDFPPWSGGMEPLVELSWLAGRFPTVGIGVTAAVLPLRDVLWVAKQAATLDVLTEGRFILALTPGIWEREFEFRGRPFATRGEQLEDGVRALLASFHGRTYEGSTATLPAGGELSPRPLTPGGPPVWLAGERRTMERALRLGFPFQVRATTPQMLEPLAAEWFDRGGSELTVRVSLEVATRRPPRDSARGSVAQVNGIVGPPEYLLEQLRWYESLGVSDVSIMPGRDDATSVATIDALGREILPGLRTAG